MKHKTKTFIGLLTIILIGVIIIFTIKKYNNDLLVQCSTKAENVVENEQKNKKDPSDLISQTNHYNRSLKKCIVNIATAMTIDNKIVIQNEIRDAYGGETYITCYSDPLGFCTSSPNIKKPPSTTAEGNLLIKDYMSK